METFRAFRVYDDGKFGSGRAVTMSRAELDRGSVVVRTAFASVNYKDALTALGKAKIARKFPLVAGIDLAGTVESSQDARFKAGDEVIVHSFGLGGEHDGSYADVGRFPAEWVVPLPKGLTLFDASALGVAGHTVGVGIDLMQLNGLTPDKGKVLVNGATGGAASVAIDILSGLGFHVVALTGKMNEADYLRSLGAAEVIDRHSMNYGTKPLEAAMWAGAVDSVGGEQLAWLIRTMQREGVITAFGNASGNEFKGNVLPFILRGVRVLGTNVDNPLEGKKRIWQRLATDLKPRCLERIARRIRFDALPQAFDDLLAARMRGRQVVDFSLR
ncbi:MAG: acryloyl-CoA reductase [Betaproteobacteria bacterium]|nr:acryloyl-CoA reductase [Betaproteobacteria bacterium]